MAGEEWVLEEVDSVDSAISKLKSLAAFGAFRGQAKKDWHLCPTLLRRKSCGKSNCEVTLLKSFCEKAREFLFGPERDYANEADLLHALPLARHYGVPTRALDWTENPLIAAYFAFASANPEEMKADGVVWWFDARSREIGGKFESSLNRYWDGHRFVRNPAGQIDLTRLFDRDGLPDRQFVTKIYYPRVVDRMARQSAFLTVAGALDVDQQVMIKHLSQEECGRVVIPSKLKRNLLIELAHMGIHAGALGDTIIDRIGASISGMTACEAGRSPSRPVE